MRTSEWLRRRNLPLSKGGESRPEDRIYLLALLARHPDEVPDEVLAKILSRKPDPEVTLLN